MVPLAQRLAVEVLAKPGQPLKRDEVLGVEIDHLGLEARSVLGRAVTPCGNGAVTCGRKPGSV